jgi:hypothetical protein
MSAFRSRVGCPKNRKILTFSDMGDAARAGSRDSAAGQPGRVIEQVQIKKARRPSLENARKLPSRA